VRARPRTQSSLAVRGDEGPWFLVNASPDARQQLLLRESATPVRVYGDAGVERALRDGYPVLTILEHYSGVRWQTLPPEQLTALDGSSLLVEPFDVGGDAPRYLNGSGVELGANGFVFRDQVTGGVLSYVPGLARLDDDVLARFAASDLVLVDGTFWRDDELAQLGISARSAREMGHVPLSGPGGTLEALAELSGPRKALVHINNSNPILFEDSDERDAVLQAGVEIGYDGLEFEL
jgi:pyrroloquinoline quinone biosynthesis protein B